MILAHYLYLSMHLSKHPSIHSRHLRQLQPSTLYTVHCVMCYLMCTTPYRTVGARMAATTRTSQVRYSRLRTQVRTHSTAPTSLHDLMFVCTHVRMFVSFLFCIYACLFACRST